MPSPNNTTNITPPRVPLIDERSGFVSREWYRFFLNLFTLTGSGTNVTSLTDLQLGPPAPQQEDLVDIIIDVEATKIQPTQESALDQIAELAKQVEALSVLPLTSWVLSELAELQSQIDGLSVTSVLPVSFLTNGSSILYGDNLGGFSNVAIGSGVSFSGGTLSATGSGGTVTSVGATAPITTTGGTTPVIGVTAAALTEVDDTNVTLTLGGSPSTALLAATSLTLGWTGQLATTRGGTGLSSFTANGVVYASSTSALATSSNFTFDGSGVVVSVNSASDGLRITQLGAGNALVVEDSANPDATPFVVNATGKVIVGYTTSVTGTGPTTATSPPLQVHGITNNTSSIGLYNWSSTGSLVDTLSFNRSLSNTIGTFGGAVTSGVDLGAVSFSGDDGTSFIEGARIFAEVDGTPGTNDMPGRLVFSTTADGASTPTERVRVNSSGLTTLGFSAVTGVALSTTVPAKLYSSNTTYTDGVTAASGTVAHGTINAFNNPAINSTNASVTYTLASTVYVNGAPTGTGNVTVGAGYSVYVAAGNEIHGANSRFGGVTAPTVAVDVTGAVLATGNVTGGYSNLAAGTTAMAFGSFNVVRVTPNANATYTTTVPAAGTQLTLIILTSGVTPYTITFGTGFKTTGTLVTGVTSARYFMVSFVSDGTNVLETARTIAIA
jgi:hypothetical protein